MLGEQPQLSDRESTRTAAGIERGRERKKRKIRSAWISFVSRIVAQFVGAAATIALGLLFLSKYQAIDAGAAEKPGPVAVSERAFPIRVSETADEVSVAVLPMLSLSADSTHEYVADGMTETLIAELAQTRGLHVISRTSTMNYKRHSKSIPEIASELRVRFVVEGSVAQADGNVRITAQLIDARSDLHVWARSYERPAKNMLGVQTEVADAIAREVEVALTESTQSY